MPKKAVSVTLDEANVLWLRGRARLSGGNVSDALDKLITHARMGKGSRLTTPISVMGMVDLSDDPLLEKADGAVREWFDEYLAKPFEVTEDPPKPVRPKKKRG